MKEKIVFFGNERLASGVKSECFTLKALIKAGYEVVAVVVNERSSSGRKKRILEVAEVAETNNIPIVVYENSQQIIDIIEQTGATVGVLAAFGRIIKQDLLDAFKYGILNIHPSLLPQYRGSTPIESAILNGDKTASVSIMLLVKEMDAGPYYAQSTIELNGEESKQGLYEQLSEIGALSLIELLPSIIDGSVEGMEQEHGKATYCGTIDKEDSKIDWTNPAAQIQNEVRSYLGWPGSKAIIAEKEVTIILAEVSDNIKSLKPGEHAVKDKGLYVQCGNGSLKIVKLKPAGKQEMDVAGFINGYLN